MGIVNLHRWQVDGGRRNSVCNNCLHRRYRILSMSTEPDAKPLADAPEAEEPSAPPTPYEMDRYECRACGYVYEPVRGDGKSDILPGMPFDDLPITWRCPVCGTRAKTFSNVGPAGKASGFSENLGYGLGVNTLTPGQKNILIFGALAVAFAFFMSLYGLK